MNATYFHSPELPWTVPEDEQERYRKILKRAPWKIIGHPPDDLDQGGAAP